LSTESGAAGTTIAKGGESPETSGRRTILRVRHLTAENFAPFGQVLQAAGPPDRVANSGTADIYHDVAAVDVAAEGGRVRVSVAQVRPQPLPLNVELMERHPLGSQAIAPLSEVSMLVIVAPPGPLDLASIVAFRAWRQGVNYNRDVWHHPLVVLGRGADFLIVDRVGQGDNLVIERLKTPLVIEAAEDGSVS
jgi:ureidoglycolate lyase